MISLSAVCTDFPTVVGFDGKLPMAPVNQNAELNELGSSVVKHGIHGLRELYVLCTARRPRARPRDP
jgi:hypothetical protein